MNQELLTIIHYPLQYNGTGRCLGDNFESLDANHTTQAGTQMDSHTVKRCSIGTFTQAEMA